MPLFRSCAAGLALAVLATGCGGQAKKTERTTSGASPSPVSYTEQHVKDSLLHAGDVAKGVHVVPVTFTGFAKGKAPSCADTMIDLKGKTTAHQFGPSETRSSAPSYAQQAAVFDDAAAAAEAFTKIASTVGKCPGQQHVASKKLSRKQITLPYTSTWKTTRDSVGGWTHVQGFEKRTYSPSSSIINVIYEVYDYATRGNAVIASLYLKRVKPSAAGDPVAKEATALLGTQVTKIG